MSRIKGYKSNFRVVIEPRGLGHFGFISTSDHMLYGRGPEAEKKIAAAYQERCEEIIAQVKRHVDEIGRAYVEFDQTEVCEHCGYEWTEENSDYNGGCCQKDQDDQDSRTKPAEMDGAEA